MKYSQCWNCLNQNESCETCIPSNFKAKPKPCCPICGDVIYSPSGKCYRGECATHADASPETIGLYGCENCKKTIGGESDE